VLNEIISQKLTCTPIKKKKCDAEVSLFQKAEMMPSQGTFRRKNHSKQKYSKIITSKEPLKLMFLWGSTDSTAIYSQESSHCIRNSKPAQGAT